MSHRLLTLPRDARSALGEPALKQLDPEQWAALGATCYGFARQARHDAANLYSGLKLVEAMDELLQQGADLSDEGIDAAWVKRQRAESLSAVTAAMHHFVPLSQAANPAAYRPAEPVALGDVLKRLAAPEDRAFAQALEQAAEEAPGVWLVEFGDMLVAALAVPCHQWAPGLAKAPPRNVPEINVADESVELRFAAPDCHTDCGEPGVSCDDCRQARNPREHSTLTLALCIAGSVIKLHGGRLQLSGENEDRIASVTLPRIRGQAA